VTEPTFQVLDEPEAAVAELLAAAARRGGTIGLTGGTSVGHAYEKAAALEPDWSRVAVFWGDERCVPPDDERSNFLLARQTLLDNLERPPEVHRIRGELEPEEAALEYDEALDGVRFDLKLLGLGPDAHMASLFPGSPQLTVRDRRVTSGPAGLEPFVDRVTMTVPMLLSIPRLVFLCTGADKAEAVRRAFRDDVSEDAPASLLRQGDSPIEVYLDRAAASGL
jgi:6-phosphogluconolactonase